MSLSKNEIEQMIGTLKIMKHHAKGIGDRLYEQCRGSVGTAVVGNQKIADAGKRVMGIEANIGSAVAELTVVSQMMGKEVKSG